MENDNGNVFHSYTFAVCFFYIFWRREWKSFCFVLYIIFSCLLYIVYKMVFQSWEKQLKMCCGKNVNMHKKKKKNWEILKWKMDFLLFSTDFVEKFKSFYQNETSIFFCIKRWLPKPHSESKTHFSQIVFKFFDQNFVNFI